MYEEKLPLPSEKMARRGERAEVYCNVPIIIADRETFPLKAFTYPSRHFVSAAISLELRDPYLQLGSMPGEAFVNLLSAGDICFGRGTRLHIGSLWDEKQ
jgi:hypothetical protein